MKRRQAVFTTACLLIFSIVSGYVLTMMFGLPVSVGALTGLCTLGVVALFGLKYIRRITAGNGIAFRRIIPVPSGWLLVVLMVGWMYGTVRAPMSNINPAWLGSVVTVNGRVLSTYPGRRENTVYVLTSTITRESVRARCEVVVLWKTGMSHLQKGDYVAVRGTLVLPDKRASLRSAPSTLYELSGRAAAVTAPTGTMSDRIEQASLQLMLASHVLTRDDAILAYSIVFGGPDIDTATKQAFLSAGLMHVLAASGANLMILESTLSYILHALWRRFRLPHALWYVQMLALVWLFAAACRFDVSVVRAACMSSYRLAGRWSGRRVTLPGGLLASGVLMAVLNPRVLASVSAILSFGATAALAYALHSDRPHRQPQASSWLGRVVGRTWAYARRLVRSTVFIELSILPVTVVTFQQWTPYSVISNLLADPLLALLLPVTAVWLGALWLANTVSVLNWLIPDLGWVVSFLLTVLRRWVEWIAALPFALLTLPPVPWWLFIPYFVILWQSFGPFHKVRRKPQRE